MEEFVQHTHLTHPFKVEGTDWRGPHKSVTGRQMFKTRLEAEIYAEDQNEDESSLPVLHSASGDTEFA